jgi:hypothetical protein
MIRFVDWWEMHFANEGLLAFLKRFLESSFRRAIAGDLQGRISYTPSLFFVQALEERLHTGYGVESFRHKI